MDGNEGEGYLVVQVLNVFLYRINKLGLVLLYRTTNLHEYRSARKITIGKESTYLWPNEKRIES